MQKTDLNVSPYYDDYAEASNFHRVLFRPAFSVQARELTQMQSILQNQIEKFGSHFFKEGATVVPGQSGFDLTYSYVTLQATFTDSNSVVHTIENYRTSLVGMKLTGATSGVIAKVLNTTAATTDDALTLFVKYESCGTESGGTTNFVFSDGESITSDSALSYSTGGTTYTIAANLQVGTTSASDAAGTGSAASVQAGVFYIRGTFVAAQTQTLILDKYSNRPSYRVGFTITESLVSPEEDTALLDNATGSSNYAAKGAHRLKYILTLTKKVLGSSDDADFIQLMSIKNGQLESQVRSTEYSVLEETLARRTYDESGDYVVRGFNIDLREHLNTGLNDGVYTEAEGGLENKVAIGLSPGKAYVRGYEITTISQTFVALEKGRTTQSVQNYSTTFNAGNYVQVENVHGMPEIADFDSDTLPFKTVELINQRLPVTHMSTAGIISSATSVAVDSLERFPTATGFHIKIDDEILKVSGISGTTLTVTRGQLGTTAVDHLENAKVTGWGINPRITPNSRANTVGVSKSRAFEVKIGSAGTGTNNHMWSTTSRWQHYLFDVRMLVKLTFSAANKFTSSNFLHNGARIKGSVSGATGYVYIPPQDVDFTHTVTKANGTANITVVDTNTVQVGQGITGSGIPDDTYITSITSDTVFVISANAETSESITATIGNASNSIDGSKYTKGTTFHVIQTTGQFVATDQITSNITQSSGSMSNLGGSAKALDTTITPVHYKFNDAHSVYSAGADTPKDYIADIYPQDALTLSGTVSATGNTGAAGTIVNGTNTGFNTDLKVGDLVEVQDTTGVVRRLEVKTITSDTSFTTVETIPVTITNSTILRVRSILEEQEELVMLSKLPKTAVKTLKSVELNNKVDTTLTVRRQQTVTCQGGIASIKLPEGESFVAYNIDDYMIQVLNDGGGTYLLAGQLLYPNDDTGSKTKITISGTTLTITIDSGASAVLKVLFTVQVAVSNEKTKTLQPMNTVTCSVQKGGVWGTNFEDEEISLNKADIFKVRGIYESPAAGTTPILPNVSYKRTDESPITSLEIFQAGQTITGSNGAIARVVDGTFTGSTSSVQIATIVYLTTKVFTAGITISSTQSNHNDLTTTAIVAGHSEILSNYTVDTGQRDTFYDIGKLVRKPGFNPPSGQITIVFDYFTHGAGDYFSVDSYPTGSGVEQIAYSDIPIYSAQRIDPDTISPTGEYLLTDTIDFRPRIGDYSGTNTVASNLSITPFSFYRRDYTVGSASLVDVPKTDVGFLSSFDYYLGQKAALFLDSDGQFKTTIGGAAESPEWPSTITDAMKMATFAIPPYTFAPTDVAVRKEKNRRFTMKDIGKISDRVDNVEYYTQLSMLEKDTSSFQIQDGDGLDRFKNGFVVDNFRGHGVGNAAHPDYQNSMDMAKAILRPEFKHRVVEIEEVATTDSLRTAAGYQKSGDLLTLPYSETIFATQPYASRIENVNPFAVMAWIGSVVLDPSSDIWRDTTRMPNLIVNVEGNYDTLIARNNGSAINTIWNEWETFWQTEDTSTKEWKETTFANFVPGKGRRVMETTTQVLTGIQTREGVRTEITPRIDHESQGDSVVSTDILPYCRARSISIDGTVFKGRSRLYAFFDNVDVSQYCTPTMPYINKYTGLTAAINSSDGTITVTSTAVFDTSGLIKIDDELIYYGSKNSTQFLECLRGRSDLVFGQSSAASHANGAVVYKTPAMGDPIITGATGKMKATFHLPDPNISGNPAFKVGERILRLTSDSANGVLQSADHTAGSATYFAKGHLDHIQETIIATRNADVVESDVNEEEEVSSTRISDKQVGWYDPLAQSFLITDRGGAFVTSVDVYFQSKSENIPLMAEIRTMANGYPTKTILPFSKISLEPSEVNISEDASVSTNIKFPAPVYLMQDIEYCFVILANTQDYNIWLSHMGDVEVGGSRTISEQPYAGVLFKSQNASTWTAAQMEDLKFNLYRASFTTSPGTITFQNKTLPSATLPASPIQTIPGTKKIRVNHPNHGMYNQANNNITMSSIVGSVTDSGSNVYDFSSLGTFTKENLVEVGLDHYIIDLTGVTNAPVANFAADVSTTGGTGVQATENYMMDNGKLILQQLELSGTDITTSIRTTTGTSPSSSTGGHTGGTESSFTLTAYTSAKEISPNNNIRFEVPTMIASEINETNEMAGVKSFQALVTLSTTAENISPVIDLQRLGLMPVQNRINNISANTDLYSTSTLNSSTLFSDQYRPSTLASGDNNAGIYITRKVSLANASSSIKVIFDAVRFSSGTFEVYHKILRSDDTTPFDDLTWEQLVLDKNVTESSSYDNWREYTYSAGDDTKPTTTGGADKQTPLDPFIAFAIKIVMKGTNSAEPSFIKALRAIACA